MEKLKLFFTHYKKLVYISLATLLLIFSITGVLLYNQHQQEETKQAALEEKKQREQAYLSKLKQVIKEMIVVGAEAEGMINQYTAVWHSAIYNDGLVKIDGEILVVSNFNEALAIQYNTFKENGDNQRLSDGIAHVEKLLKQLKSPPKKYQKHYESVLDMYGNFNQFTNLALSPRGSYDSFTKETRELSNKIVNTFNKLKIRIPGGLDLKKENGSTKSI